MRQNVQRSYNQVAEDFARHSQAELKHKPYDRQILDAYASSVRGLVCDLGCGAGHVARHLQEKGVEVLGIDLSDGMLERARQLNPGIPFIKANMKRIPVEDEAWGGIVGFYCLCHIPRPKAMRVLGEMRRALKPSGLLLLAYHVGRGTIHREQWGTARVSLDTTFFMPGEINSYLIASGFEIEGACQRPPYVGLENPNWRGFVRARRTAGQPAGEGGEVGAPPLFQAVQHGTARAVQTLLGQEQVSPNITFDGVSPLHLAASDGRVDIVGLLVRHGARVDAATSDGRSAFHLAALMGQGGTARRLLEAGADPLAPDSFGNTPLHHACMGGQVEFSRWLLQLKADPQAGNRWAQTPLFFASRSMCAPLVALLQEACAPTNGSRKKRPAQ